MKIKEKVLLLVVALSGLFVHSQATIIDIGDVVDIRVVGYPELSGRYTVGNNGSITYPLLADEIIVNVTTSELMNDLVFRLAGHIEHPLVLVSIVEKPEIAITVLGQVADPGPVIVRDGASIQEVIQKAGGILPSANLERVKLLKGGRSDHFYDINLKEFFLRGEVEDMPTLNDQDVVVVLKQDINRKVKVLGAVQKPGAFELDGETNVFELIYLAGGPSENADLTRVRRLSSGVDEKTIEEVLDIQELIDKGDMDNMPQVNEGDVILVYSRWFDWKTMLSIMNNALLFIVVVQSFIGLFD
ncbi:Polysaccharide export lipoprotein [Chitinispirillum alkaliphilum]|nr:Polysaccharide export lipoprotein [Chitinispirillum alkaliphilum]